MSTQNFSQILNETVERLSQPQSLRGLFHQHRDGYPLPSASALGEIIDLARSILFPGYFGASRVNQETIHYAIGVNTERMHRLLKEQVLAGLCFADDCGCCTDDMECRREKSLEIATNLVASLPKIRETLATDVEAAYNGDPAATSRGEIISCYPVIKALTNYRIAHELWTMQVPLIPRIITEMAHSETGIDIHPRAQIGHHFTIDHGTGVVVGATCVIGNNVKLYQGVTLGAKSFPLDEDGNPIKGIPRHPILEDDVIVYANATILGRVTIGHGSVIGANVWITKDVKPNSKIYNKE